MQINEEACSKGVAADLPVLADAATLPTMGRRGVRWVEIFDFPVNKTLHSNSGFICQCIGFEVRSK